MERIRGSQRNSLLTWAMLACLATLPTQADVLKYGTRLRPPSQTAFLAKDQNCVTCIDTDTKPRVQSIPEVDPTSAIRLDSNEASKATDTNLRNLRKVLTSKPLVKNQQTTSPIFSEVPKDNPKRGATFFFTQVEPHRFEYRAMFQHHRNAHSEVFEPFVHDFDAFSKGFPPLPKLPAFPDFFNERKDPPLPDIRDYKFPTLGKDPLPDIKDFKFPTLPPSIKRFWQQTPPLPDVVLPRPQADLDPNLGGPQSLDKDIEGILRQGMDYPKIFRFNEERVNIESFDREKKLRFYSLGQREQNELLEPENVKRDQLLILHGGVFTVQEPPVFKKYPIKKRRKPGSFGLYHRPLRL